MNLVRLRVVRVVLAIVLLPLLPACAAGSFAQRQDAQRDQYHAYAGPPVEQFTWLGRYYSWSPLGHDELVVFTTPFDAYLLRVLPPCTDLPFANVIGLTDTARTVSRRFDFVLVHTPGLRGPASLFRCPIDEIRKVDYQRMRQDIREHGPLKGAPAQSAPPPPPPVPGQKSTAT